MKQSDNREIIHFEKNTLFWRLENSNFQKEGNKMEDITRETIADETVARMIECKDSFRKSDRLSSFVVARETDLHFLWLFTRFDHYVNILAHSSREEKERERERERERDCTFPYFFQNHCLFASNCLYSTDMYITVKSSRLNAIQHLVQRVIVCRIRKAESISYPLNSMQFNHTYKQSVWIRILICTDPSDPS